MMYNGDVIITVVRIDDTSLMMQSDAFYCTYSDIQSYLMQHSQGLGFSFPVEDGMASVGQDLSKNSTIHIKYLEE